MIGIAVEIYKTILFQEHYLKIAQNISLQLEKLRKDENFVIISLADLKELV